MPHPCEPLESRRFLAFSPAVAAEAFIKVKNLFDANGVSVNESLVTVPFTQGVQIKDSSKIQVRGYAIDPLTGGQKKLVVSVLDVAVGTNDAGLLVIHTDRLMRKIGGKIIFYAGAPEDTKGRAIREQTVSSPQGQNKERFTLACRGFLPTDKNLFSNDLYDGASAPNDASAPIADNTVTANLTSFLQKKLDKGIITAQQMADALVRYDDSIVKQIIPSANLRAGMMSLVGTAGEPAIGAMLDGENVTGKPQTIIDFSKDVSASAEVAETKVTASGRLRTLFMKAYTGEPFQALGAKLAHEAVHQDADDGQQEEIIACSIETFVYAQQMMVDSSFISAGTGLVKSDNDRVYAMLESGKAQFPRVGELPAAIRNPSAGIFVGALSQTGGAYTSFENYIRRLYQAREFGNFDSLGNDTLAAMFANITGVTKAVSFGNSLISDLDSSQQLITDKAAIALAGILKLTL